MHIGSKARLTVRSTVMFPGEALFDRIARAVCSAECLPRKELFESWEMARRIRRRFRGGRIVDLAAGHGLLGQILLLLDDSSPEVVGVDRAVPGSAERLRAALQAVWPRLAGRVRMEKGELEGVRVNAGDLIVSAHACGGLTDVVLAKALGARARVAVLPCCHAYDEGETGGLEGWVDGALAIDVMRALRMQGAGYRTYTLTIPEAITPKRRLLLAEL